jgi:hypothetical protein
MQDMIRVFHDLSFSHWLRLFRAPGTRPTQASPAKYFAGTCATPTGAAPTGAASTRRLIELASGAVWSLELESDTRLSACTGTVWVTRSGDAQDYLLQSGEALRFANNGSRIVVQAIDGRAVFELC